MRKFTSKRNKIEDNESLDVEKTYNEVSYALSATQY